MFNQSTILIAATLAGAALASTAAASAASAATTAGTVTAHTKIVQRYDGGGAGNWAVDSMGRTLVISYLGKSGNPADPYAFDAQLSDNGGFTDLPGQATRTRAAGTPARSSSRSRWPAR